MLSAILGRKVGMTQVFGPNGTALPATVIEAGPCTITQLKAAASDGYEAVQIGYDQIKEHRATRAALGHLGHTLEATPHQRRKQQQQGARDRQKAREAKDAQAADDADESDEGSETEADEAEARAESTGKSGGKASAKASNGKAGDRRAPNPRRKRAHGLALGPFRVLREVRALDAAAIKLGDVIDAGMFRVGEEVDIIGTSKGKGFAGVMKRHGFRGGQRTHGQSDRARHPGSIGAGTTPGRVLKNTRMAGRMGNARVTIKKLEVLQADPGRNLLVIRGSVPGPNGGLLLIRKIAGQTQLLEHLGVESTLEQHE
jgi:large subunit ribosomal protein L3